jgi:hypothetical protein
VIYYGDDYAEKRPNDVQQEDLRLMQQTDVTVATEVARAIELA